MVAQNVEEIVGKFFFECVLTQNKPIKIHNSRDSSRSYRRLFENPKTRCSRELFLPENNFKICSAVNSTKWFKN